MYIISNVTFHILPEWYVTLYEYSYLIFNGKSYYDFRTYLTFYIGSSDVLITIGHTRGTDDEPTMNCLTQDTHYFI